MYKLMIASLLAIVCNLNTQAQFVVNDILAVSPQASVFDPEYNTKFNIVCWKSDDNKLWISGLNPVTHMYQPADGKGTLVTGNLSPNGDGSWNGPEWMLSSLGTQIVYNQTICGIRYPGVAKQVLGGWQCNTLFQYPGAVYSMATSNYADSTARFLFETNGSSGISWVCNSDLNTSYFRPDVTIGFFSRDDQQICCATSQAKHPGFIEVSAPLPYFTAISEDTIGAPFMWNDPATNSRLYIYRTNGNKTMKVFRELPGGDWTLYNQFNSPLPEPFQYITSPEPFTCGGRSYISFMAAQSGSGKAGLPAQIWIAGTNPADSLMWRVSDSTEAIRTDPEPVVFNDSAFVYYTYVPTDKKLATIYSVRKCDTGLATLFTSTENPKAAKAHISAFPNPGNGFFTLQIPAIFNKKSTIEVFDANGHVVFSKANEVSSPQLDLKHLPSGSYILKIRNLLEEASTRLTIVK